MATAPLWFSPTQFGEDSPAAPDGYFYGSRSGSFTCHRDGKRVPASRMLLPVSGCVFDAAPEYSHKGVVLAREKKSIDIRLQVCACPVCKTWLKSPEALEWEAASKQ